MNYKFVAFDLDGVLVDTFSSWVWMHEYFGVNNDHSLFAYQRGEIDYLEFMRRDIQLWLEKKKEGINLHKTRKGNVPSGILPFSFTCQGANNSI